MNLLDSVDFEYIYVALSLVVAVLIWVETTWILKNEGKMPESSTFATISLITSSWLVVSGLAMYFLNFDNLQMSVPACYGVYFVTSWVYGSRLISVADIDDPMDLVMPAKYLDFCRAFALVFALLCVLVLSAPHLPLLAGLVTNK